VGVDGRTADLARPDHGLRLARGAVAYTFAVSGALLGSWAPRIPQVKADLGLGPGALGVALVAPAAGSLLAMPLAGAAAARWGSRPVTRLLLAAFCLLPGLVGFASDLWSLWLALFVWGSTVGALDVCMNAQGVSVERRYGRPLLSGLHAAFSVGGFAGAGAGSAAAALDVPVGWQLAGLGAVLLAVGWPLSGAFVPDVAPPGGAASRTFVLPSGRLLVLGCAAFASFVCEGAAADWSSVHLRESLGVSAGVAGAAFAGFSLAMTVGRVVGDRVTARLGAVRTLRASAALAATGLAAGLATGTVAGGVAGFCLFGAGLSCVVPILFSAAGSGTGASAPSIAAVATCGYLGWLLGPTLVGGLAQAVGLAGALWALPVLAAAAGVLAFGARS
jgi:hypothetical protein